MPEVTSVSTASPRIVEINGHPILTSIVHDPHPGPLMFGPAGPDGNSTAVHTEHILAGADENYDYWSSYLGVARSSWTGCFWGENLTLRGVNENSLRIGDLLRVGAAAVFEVTSPRIPCMKLSWRLGQPDTFLRTLVDSGLTGFYLRVLRAGPVSPGDRVIHESPHPDSITVGDLSRLLHDDTTDVERLRAVLALPGLGEQAAAMLRHRIVRLTDGARCKQGRWQGWRPFEVVEVKQETPEVRTFTLAPLDRGPLADYCAGQFLTVRLQTAPGTQVIRSWSLSDYHEGGSVYRLTIRRIADGHGSGHMHDVVRIGDKVEARSPSGGFVLDRSGVLRVVLISAGIGLTPVLSMLKAHSRREDAPPLLWVHSTRNSDTHLFREEVAAVVRGSARFRAHVSYTAPLLNDRPQVDYDEAGRLSVERLERILGKTYVCRPFGRDIELPTLESLYYICGPADFEVAMRRALGELGVRPRFIFSELFAPMSRNIEPEVERCEVRFVRSAQTAVWDRQSGLTLLELAEERGIEAPFSCRIGTCRTCATRLIAGRVSYGIEVPAPAPAGQVLLCCSQPGSDRLDLDL